MTTKEAVLAMRIGCKIQAPWMNKQYSYYIHNNQIWADDFTVGSLCSIEVFITHFQDETEWSIV